MHAVHELALEYIAGKVGAMYMQAFGCNPIMQQLILRAYIRELP